MIKVCAKGPTVKGIDVSRWQKPLDWAYQKRLGVQYMFAKASEHMNLDRSFKLHIEGARAQGLITGAYHYFHPAGDPQTQARAFVDLVKSTVGSVDLPLVMDWETTDGTIRQADKANGLAFLHTVEKMSGRKPIIYSSPYFLKDLGLMTAECPYKLWVAHYHVSCPLVPPPWVDWTFWQIAGDGVDSDLFNGSMDDLKALVKS